MEISILEKKMPKIGIEEELFEDKMAKTTKTESNGKKRRLLSDDNKYVFILDEPVEVNSNDSAKVANTLKEEINNLHYKDGAVVSSGFRVWEVCKDLQTDANDIRIGGTVIGHILARTQDQACTFFLKAKGYDVELGNKKRSKGRGKSRIDKTIQDYGRMLACNIFPTKGENQLNSNITSFDLIEKPNKEYVSTWVEMFSPSGTYAHYLHHDGEYSGQWKDPTINA